MARFKIMNKCRYGDACRVIKDFVAVHREVNNGKESVGINLLVITHFFHGLVSKAKVNTKSTQTL